MFLPLHLFILFSKWEDSRFAILQICKYVFYFFFFFSSGHCNLANYSQSQVLLDSNLVLQGKVKTHDFSQKLQKGPLFVSLLQSTNHNSDRTELEHCSVWKNQSLGILTLSFKRRTHVVRFWKLFEVIKISQLVFSKSLRGFCSVKGKFGMFRV